MCLWNDYCLCKLKAGATVSIAKFHLDLIEQILTKYDNPETRYSDDNNELKLIEKNYSVYIYRKKQITKMRCLKSKWTWIASVSKFMILKKITKLSS